MTDEVLHETVPIGILAGLFGVTERQARNLLEAAKVKPESRGRWPFAASVQAIYAKARENRESSALTKARARAISASARKTELATAKAERELVPRDEVDLAIAEICASVRNELDGLPARLTRDRIERKRIDEEVRASLGRIAQDVKRKAGQLESGELEHDYD